MRIRRGLLFWGLFLIPLGVIPLLAREGVIDLSGIGEAVVLAGPDSLTLTLEDGRRLLFSVADTGGKIVGHGILEAA